MVVKAKSGRLGMTGLHVGDGNVQRLFPPDVPIPGFDPARHLIENALGC